MIHVFFVTALQKAIPNCKIIYTCHYLDPTFTSLLTLKDKFNFSIASNELQLYQIANKIITVSNFAKEIIVSKLGILSSKVTCIYNGVSIKNQKKINYQEIYFTKIKESIGFNAKERIVLFVGRVNNYKGIDKLIEAFRQLQYKIPFLRLVIVGDGEHSKVFSLCYGFFPKVCLTGPLKKDEVNKLYKIAEVGVIPSEYEQCSYVALEMMSHALPIVISDVPGLNELVEHGDSGLICKTNKKKGDLEGREVDVNSLTLHIEYLVKNKKMARVFGNNALHLIQTKHSAQLMSEKTIRLYFELISHIG